jgi:hypothetical protein
MRNWFVALCTALVLCAGSFSCEKENNAPSWAECVSSNDCPLGLDCYEWQCRYPCDENCPPCDCPVGSVCDTRIGYCTGTSDCPGFGPERCDGVDNDCDGRTDEDGVCNDCEPGSFLPCVVDHLYGPCAVGQMLCLTNGSPSGICQPVEGPEPEVCTDRVDNDCNGAVNDGCPCDVGDSHPCGPDSAVGACRQGVQLCEGDVWGTCTGAIFPEPEVCGDRVDNNCNGEVDENCGCEDGATRACLTGMDGVCAAGTQTCNTSDHTWTPCLPFSPSSTETCNGLDDDCDGVADEDVCFCPAGATRACYTGLLGACEAGSQTCSADGRNWSPCATTYVRVSETCNGVDDDCDGEADEEVCTCVSGATRSCDTGREGICSNGSQTCSADGRSWSPCLPVLSPIREDCTNGLDEDCDGLVNNGCACDAGVTYSCVTTLAGICADGQAVCQPDGSGYGFCVPLLAPTDETCNGLDDDCDGVADEDVCFCPAGATRACYTGLLGACEAGSQTCSADGRNWSPCATTYVRVSETCNGVDDDCDGEADEGLINACGICGPVPPELCDGLDNDCDGAIDDGCECTIGTFRSCGTDMGPCVVGTQTCLDNGFGLGQWSDCGGTYVGPTPEVCGDGIDNNCDGFIDNGCTTPICTTPGSPEICDNGLDDDCDGLVDEGCTGPGRYEHCWTLPATAPRVAFEGCTGWAILTGPGDGIDGRLVCTRPWSLIAETTGASSFCFAVALDSGQYIEYNSVSDLVPDYWGCVGPYPPGTLNGAHTATLGGAPAAFTLVDNRLGGCNFRYRRP